MSVSTASCLAPEDQTCDPLPPWFVRLKYFFGKRMTVADFLDEQRYHIGKLRFHQRNQHGAGVLAGLGLTLFDPASFLVRVGKGAAVDREGREIIVGADQCVDVEAWLERTITDRRAKDKTDTWPAPLLDADGWLELAVMLRYVECSTHPEPAPRDPCSCAGDGGCEFGRVREGFELSLVDADEAAPFGAVTPFPSAADLARAAASSLGAADFRAALAALVANSAPPADPEPGGWLVVGSLRIKVVDDQATAIALHAPAEPFLLSTAAIQELLLGVLGASFEGGFLAGDGPSVVGLMAASPAAGTVTLSLKLSQPLEGATVQADSLALRRFVSGTGWRAPAAGKATVAYDAAGPAMVLTLTNDEAAVFFEPGGLYRLSLVSDAAQPICDPQLRPLTPLRFSCAFTVDQMTPDFALSPVPYAP